ncbi:MAG: protein-glutamate O-methyltransferase CheR [Pseudomonadota bacterium]
MPALASTRSETDDPRRSEFQFGDDDFQRIAQWVKQTAGIHLDANKADLVYARVTKRLRALKTTSFCAYLDYTLSDAGLEERDHLLNALTTNVTRFFREPHHFNALRETILPPLIEKARNGGRVRIWSAGCSSGEEPYSIAMTLLSVMADANQHDIKILASDIDSNMLNKAQRGRYRKDEIELPPDASTRRFLQPVADKPGCLDIQEDLKNLVAFRRLNLIKPWPVRGPFDVIFCRNVVIYFDPETQDAVWQKLARVNAPGGWLMLGHSERITGPAADGYELEGFTTYNRTNRI